MSNKLLTTNEINSNKKISTEKQLRLDSQPMKSSNAVQSSKHSFFSCISGKYKFADIYYIEEDVLSKGKKCDFGICSECGVRIKVAQERFIGSAFGKKEMHFCENCGIYLRENPFNAILHGLGEIVFFLMIFIVFAANQKGSLTKTQSLIGLVVLLPMIDGIRRLLSGFVGCFCPQQSLIKYKRLIQEFYVYLNGEHYQEKLEITCPNCNYYANVPAKISCTAICPKCKTKFTIEEKVINKKK
jgi:hypothetical protein